MNDVKRIERIARILDSVVTVPGTKVKIGLDPILGIIPGVGDAIASFMSAIILYEAASAGVPKRHLLRMLGNVVIDSLVGAIPVLGDIFDFAFRANERNLEIIRSIPAADLLTPRDPKAISTLIVGLLLIALVLISAGAIFIVRAIFRAFS